MSKDKKRNIANFRTSKLPTMILSILIAIAVWLVAVYVDDPSITVNVKNVPVRFINEDQLTSKGLIIKEKEDIPNYSVRVSGRRSHLVEYMNRITIDVDLSDITSTGLHKLYGTVNIPNVYLTLEKNMNSQIPVEVAELSEKSIKLYAKQIGTNKDYLIKSEPKIPDLLIKGAKDEIDSISYALADVNITEITDDCDILGDIYYCNKEDNKVTNATSVYANISEASIKNTIYNKKTVPVTLKLEQALAEEYALDLNETTVSPSQIEVGISDDISIDEVYVYIDTLSPESKEYKITTNVSGVYIPYNNLFVEVNATIKKKVEKEIVVNVEAINTPTGLTAQFEANQTVVAYLDENITDTTIKATIDLKGLSKGTNQCKLILDGDGLLSYDEKYISVELQ